MVPLLSCSEPKKNNRKYTVFSRKKCFVIPTKSFVKIGIAKVFCYNKMFTSINKLFGSFLVEAIKNSFAVPNFVPVTKPFFSVLKRYTRGKPTKICE